MTLRRVAVLLVEPRNAQPDACDDRDNIFFKQSVDIRDHGLFRKAAAGWG